MLIFGTCIDIVSKTKLFLESKFEMKDMGEASVILGVKVIEIVYYYFKSNIMRNFLESLVIYDFKSVKTFYDANSKLMKNRGESISESQHA